MTRQKGDPLFENLPLWEQEWQDMPEFVQEDLQPIRSIIVHFMKQDDVDQFATLVEQRITPKTKSLTFPEQIKRTHINKRWVDESE